MDGFKFDINELMDIHQLNNYIKSNSLTDRLITKKEIKIAKIIKYASNHYYFYYLPNDIKNIIIDLLYPSDYFTIKYIDKSNPNYNINSHILYRIENYQKQIIINFKKLNKFCILSQKKRNNCILFNSYQINMFSYRSIDIFIDFFNIYFTNTCDCSFNFFHIYTNNIELEFKVLYQK